MQRLMQPFLAIAFVVTATSYASAHCEVPCGIYGDQQRFEMMLEDQKTIEKATAQIRELAGKTDAQSVNQVVRWVTTKEAHATKTQNIIAQYFMTQRIKPGADAAGKAAYLKRLTSAHAVMVAAMKCKQSTDPAAAVTLKKSILTFYRDYEGKEYHSHEHK